MWNQLEKVLKKCIFICFRISMIGSFLVETLQMCIYQFKFSTKAYIYKYSIDSLKGIFYIYHIKMLSNDQVLLFMVFQLFFNNLQIILTMNFEHTPSNSYKNGEFVQQQLYSLSDLQAYERNLLYSLENALQTNKELILSYMVCNYYPYFSDNCSSPTYQTKEEYKQPKISNQPQQQIFIPNHQKKPIKKMRIKKKKQTYDTKNIPKNFGTAIHIFLKKNTKKVKNLLERKKISFGQFYQFNKAAKEKINSLLHLRQLWEHKQGESNSKLKECYRILSFEFMRKHCLSYIFSSRIKNCSSHVRYRKKLLEGLKRPQSLYNLKDY